MKRPPIFLKHDISQLVFAAANVLLLIGYVMTINLWQVTLVLWIEAVIYYPIVLCRILRCCSYKNSHFKRIYKEIEPGTMEPTFKYCFKFTLFYVPFIGVYTFWLNIVGEPASFDNLGSWLIMLAGFCFVGGHFISYWDNFWRKKEYELANPAALCQAPLKRIANIHFFVALAMSLGFFSKDLAHIAVAFVILIKLHLDQRAHLLQHHFLQNLPKRAPGGV